MIEFRTYQLQIINEVMDAFRAGYRKILVVLPMGGGKSITMAGLLNKLTLSQGFTNNLTVVPFTNLQDQLTETFKSMGTLSECITYHAASMNPLNTSVNVLLFDECHHIMGPSWREIPVSIEADFICGFTGTPYRSDNCPLLEQNGGFFDYLVTGPGMQSLITQDYLADYDYYAYPMVRRVEREPLMFQGDPIAYFETEHFEAADKEENMVDEYVNGFRDMPGIVFCRNTEHAGLSAARFDAVGIPTAFINYYQSKKTNDKIIKDFKNGKYKLLAACNMASEGLDVPHAKLGIMARPISTSLALFLQQVGRTIRSFKDERAKILDLVGNVYRWGDPKIAYTRRTV